MITLDEAREEFEHLSALMEEAARARPRWAELSQWLTLGEKLSRKDEQLNENGTPLPETRPDALRGRPTAEIAEHVLRKHGTGLYLDDLVQRMQLSGWQGSGYDRKDREAVRAAVKRRPDKFRNEGGNVWNLVS